MTRQDMLNRLSQLLNDEIPTRGDAARAEFDELMGTLQAHDAAQPRAVRGIDRPSGMAPGPRTAPNPRDSGHVAATIHAPAVRTTAPATALVGRARLLTETIDDLERSGDYTEVIVFGMSYTPAGLRRLIASRPPSAIIEDIQRQVHALEDRAWRRRQLEAADRDRFARLDAAYASDLTRDEDAWRRAILADALDATEHPEGR